MLLLSLERETLKPLFPLQFASSSPMFMMKMVQRNKQKDLNGNCYLFSGEGKVIKYFVGYLGSFSRTIVFVCS